MKKYDKKNQFSTHKESFQGWCPLSNLSMYFYHTKGSSKEKNGSVPVLRKNPSPFLQSLIADLANPNNFLNQLVLVMLKLVS